MSVRETKIRYLNNIAGVLKALSILTVGVVKEIRNGSNVTVGSKKNEYRSLRHGPLFQALLWTNVSPWETSVILAAVTYRHYK